MATYKFGNTTNWDHTPVVAKTAGDVVLLGTDSDVIGVIVADTAASALGAVSVSGVFQFTTADTFVQGEAAYYNVSGDVITDDATDTYAGRVAATVASGTTVLVDINSMFAPAGS
jgi:predicted RecA/RadA family phage recombinase